MRHLNTHVGHSVLGGGDSLAQAQLQKKLERGSGSGSRGGRGRGRGMEREPAKARGRGGKKLEAKTSKAKATAKPGPKGKAKAKAKAKSKATGTTAGPSKQGDTPIHPIQASCSWTSPVPSASWVRRQNDVECPAPCPGQTQANSCGGSRLLALSRDSGTFPASAGVQAAVLHRVCHLRNGDGPEQHRGDSQKQGV